MKNIICCQIFREAYKLTSFGGPPASGELRSGAGRFLCWLLQDGTNGADTGVNPVPPSIKLSKLKGIPVDGVVIGIPIASETDVVFWLVINVVGTFNELGLLGLFIEGNVGAIDELSISFLAGGSEKRILSDKVVGICSTISVFTRGSESRCLSSSKGYT